jgi:hypothetical protein
MEIEHRHDGGRRRATRLMTAHLQAVAAGAQVIGVVDHPRRQPAQPAIEQFEIGSQSVWHQSRMFVHCNPSLFSGGHDTGSKPTIPCEVV